MSNEITLTTEVLINAFYRSSDAVSNQADNLLSNQRDLILLQLEKENDDVLFNQTKLFNLKENGKIIQYLCSLIVGSSENTEVNSKRRKKCIIKSIELLKEGDVSEQGSRELVSKILVVIKYLKEIQAKQCADALLKDFNPINFSQLQGASRVLELIGPLAARSGNENRKSLIDNICTLNWTGKVTVMLSSSLLEICENEEECEKSLQKISKEIRLNLDTTNNNNCANNRIEIDENNLSVIEPIANSQFGFTDITASNSSIIFSDDVSYTYHRRINKINYIEPEELPSLLYQITSLGRKCDNFSATIKSTVVDIISKTIDMLLFALKDEIDKGETSSTSNIKRIDSVLATIIHHLSLVISKDQGISTEILSFIKNRRFIQQKEFNHRINNDYLVSPGRLLLCMLAAKSPRQQDKIISGLCEAISEIYSVKDRVSSSLWFQDKYWRTAVSLHPSHIRNAFAILLNGNIMIENISQPLAILAFSLIDIPRPHYKSHWDVLTSNTIPCINKPAPLPAFPDFLGSWLVSHLFIVCDHARTRIARDLVTRLVTLTSLSSTTTSSSSSLFLNPTPTTGLSHVVHIADVCVSIINNLVTQCPYGIVDVSSELQEAFVSLPSLFPDTAGKLVQALSRLFTRGCGVLADRCALALRKATFSQDAICRQAAVSALLALLRSQMISTTVHKDRNRNQSNIPQDFSRNGRDISTNSAPLSVDEILSLLRRFMNHQAVVRSLLYDQLYCLQGDFPHLRELMNRLLLNHMKSLLDKNNDGAWNNITNSSSIQLDLESCLDLSNRPQERIGNLILTLLALTRDGFSSLELETNDNECDSENQDNAQSQCSSQPQQPREHQREINQTALDSWDMLWNICKSNALVDFEDFGITSSDDSYADSKQNSLIFIFQEAIQASMICSINLPINAAVPPHERIRLLKTLAMNLNNLSTLIATRKSKAKKETSKKKKGTSDDSQNDHNITYDSSFVIPGLSSSSSSYGSSEEVERSIHVLSNELEFAATCIDLLNPNDDIDDDTNDNDNNNRSRSNSISNTYLLASTNFLMESCEGNADLNGHEFLHRYILEKSVYGLEKLISIFVSIKSNEKLSKNKNNNNNTNSCTLEVENSSPFNLIDDQTEDDSSYDKFAIKLHNLELLSKQLLILLIRNFMRVRSIDKDQREKDKSGKRKRNAHTTLSITSLSLLQLCMRGILGCIRVSVASTGFGLNGNTSSSSPIHERLGSIIAIAFGKKGFKRVGSGMTLNSTTFPLGTAVENSNKVNISYFKQVKNFCALLINLHRSGSVDEKSLCPLVVAILGDMIGVAPNSEKSKMSAFVFKECEEKISNPNSQLSQSLIQFFILQCPEKPFERLNRAFEIASLINKCHIDESNKQDEDEESGEDYEGNNNSNTGNEGKYTVLSKYSLPVATSCLVGILDKAYLEVESLMKLRDKLRVKTKRRIKSIDNQDGHISSDEEEDSNVGKNIKNMDDSIFFTIKKIIESSTSLIAYSSKKPEAADRLISLFVKLYKIVVKMTKNLVLDPNNNKFLSKNFIELIKFISKECGPKMDDFLRDFHQSGELRGSDGASVQTSTKASRIVPEVTFQMEQLDVQLIKLLGIVSDQSSIQKYIRRTASRDFKIRTEIMNQQGQEVQEDQDDDEENSNQAKKVSKKVRKI